MTQTSETFVKIVEKLPVNKSPCLQLKNELFHSYFSSILISFENSCFFRTRLSNCVFMFISFYFYWDIDFLLYFQRFLFFHWQDII